MKWLWTLAAACLLLQGCGGGEETADLPSSADACSVASQRASLREFMEQEYYWYAHLGEAKESAESQDEYFHSMLYKPVDRYSFTESTAAFNLQFVEGRRVGFGYALVWGDVLKIRNVEPLGPAGRAGLRRGDTVLSIDGYSPAQIAAGALPLVNTAGVAREFVVQDGAGQTRVVTIRSEDFALNPVAETATFEVMREGKPVKVGYLAYHQFAGYSWQQLQQAFARLRDEGAGELILDLRYNGGGSVLVSRDLASLIAGERGRDTMFAHLRFNDKRPGNGPNCSSTSPPRPTACPGRGSSAWSSSPPAPRPRPASC